MTGKRKAGAKSPLTDETVDLSRAMAREAAKRGRLGRILKRTAIIGLVGAILMAAGFVVAYQRTGLPDANAAFEIETTSVYYRDGKTAIGRMAADQVRQSIPLSEMPDFVKDAVVAAENRSFWTDSGIDPKGILRAAFSNARGNSQQGASTITQQYVKILYLSQERTYQRKVKEAFLSLKVVREMSKQEVLEGYLNTIYFGRGAYGIEAAAKAYFRKKARDLSLRESAVLASVINNPSQFDPANGHANKRALLERYGYVLSGMADMGTITAEEAEKASRRLPAFPRIPQQSTYGGQRGHVLSLVKSQLLKLGFSEEEISGGGLQITTTLDDKVMAAAEQGVREEKPEGFGKDLHIGVASVEPGTGALRGFYGGQDYLESQLNWAVAGGMAGSTMKAFAVSTALKEGYSLKDTFDGDSPFDANGTEFENQGDRDYGRVSLTKATANSVNTAFIDLTMSMDNGAKKIVETANAMGIPPAQAGGRKAPGFPSQTRDLEANTGVSLGTAVVSPINMANAYATIANNGEWAEPYLIEKVVDRYGRERYSHGVVNERAVDEDVAIDTSYALQQVVEEGSGSDAQALGRPAAGKTGTATNDKNDVSSAWFVGYTPQLSTAVMYVRGNGREALDGWLPSYFGGAYPLDTWRAVLERALEGEPVEDFPEPVFLDGEAPEEGHAPYTPPPPTKTRGPKKTPSDLPTVTASPTKPGKGPTKYPSEDPTPTLEPTPSEPTCGILCPSESPTDGDKGGGNQPGPSTQRVATREEYAGVA